MTQDERHDPTSGDLPDWLREEPAQGETFDLPDWLDMPEDDELSIAADAAPPAVGVPRVSPIWVTRDETAPTTSSARLPVARSSRRSHSPLFIGLAVAALLICAVLIVGLVIW